MHASNVGAHLKGHYPSTLMSLNHQVQQVSRKTNSNGMIDSRVRMQNSAPQKPSTAAGNAKRRSQHMRQLLLVPRGSTAAQQASNQYLAARNASLTSVGGHQPRVKTAGRVKTSHAKHASIDRRSIDLITVP